MPTQSFNQDKELAEFFTDVEHLRNAFKNSVAAPTLTKRLLVIHGVGGVGKSSLLHMFRLHCKGAHVPVALASGDEAKSTLDVLARWADDLKADGVALQSFGKTFEHYRAIQAKVDEQAKKAQDARSRATDIAGKAASKTGEAAGGALIGAAIGSVIPGIGTAIGGALGGVLGGMGAEALVDWMRGFLKQPDIDLLLDPAKKLTDDFLADVAPAAGKRRIVLMLDTFEQMTALDDWARDVAQRLHTNALFVIAGRALPNWGRAWQGWMANAQVEELKPMTEDVMRELIRRYYATMRGGEPNPAQVEAIIRFARGLPMVVTSAVQLWVKYGVEDFQSVKTEIVANLVDRLMEGVPNELIPALEAAAIVRWFDQPILRAVTGLADVREVYNELRRFPFVRVRVEGLALHDAVREIVDENLRAQDSERHCELHERAAAYFEKQLQSAKGQEGERLILERLYHLVLCRNESQAITESRLAIDVALGYYRQLFAESIINLLDQHLNEESSREWLAYLRFLVIGTKPNVEKQVAQTRILISLLDKPRLDPTLWALIASNLAVAPPEAKISLRESTELLFNSIESNLLPIQEKIKAYIHLGYLSRATDLKKAHEYFVEAQSLSREQGNLLLQIHSLDDLAYNYILMGDWHQATESAREGIALSRQVGGFRLTTLLKHAGWALIYTGQLSSALEFIQEALKLYQGREDDVEIIRLTRRLAEIYDRQGRWDLSNELYRTQIKKDEELGGEISKANDLGLLGISCLKQGLFEEARRCLLESLPNAHLDFQPTALNALGELYCSIGDAVEARLNFERAISLSRGNSYLVTQSRLGLLQVDLMSSMTDRIMQRIQEVEIVSSKYGYNDHLAQLCLLQGQTSISGLVREWDYGLDVASSYYQRALICALRYNRFLLDEVLSGRPQGTPLRPIIPHCLERGEEGRQMLLALRDWWKTGVNDTGTPRPDTISPIPEGITLLEAERLAREREKGDGSPQKNVVEQIEAAL